MALPIRILTGDGARVALQRCPILRAGANDSNTAPQTRRKLPPFSAPIWSGFLNEATNTISSGFLREATRELLNKRAGKLLTRFPGLIYSQRPGTQTRFAISLHFASSTNLASSQPFTTESLRHRYRLRHFVHLHKRRNFNRTGDRWNGSVAIVGCKE